MLDSTLGVKNLKYKSHYSEKYSQSFRLCQYRKISYAVQRSISGGKNRIFKMHNRIERKNRSKYLEGKKLFCKIREKKKNIRYSEKERALKY